MSAKKNTGNKQQTPANTRRSLVPDWLRNIRTTAKTDKDQSDNWKVSL